MTKPELVIFKEYTDPGYVGIAAEFQYEGTTYAHAVRFNARELTTEMRQEAMLRLDEWQDAKIKWIHEERP